MSSKAATTEVLTINTSLINKREIFRMLALAHTTGLPLLLIGPPGTGKTKVVLDYAKAWLMSGVDTSDPIEMKKAQENFMNKIYILETDEGTKSSEVKGMPDLETLFTQNKYELSTPIADAEIVIINEVDKASSAIRNSLLGVMNEKFLFNGKHKIPCKWKLLIATCNEIPKDEMGSPFWDRFILKQQVNRVQAGDLVKYFAQGGKKFNDNFNLPLPTAAELEVIDIPVPKLEKYLDVAYAKCSDRTITFVPTLTRAVSQIWNENIDKSLVKVAGMMVGSSAGSELQNKLMSQEVKVILTKVEMINSLNTSEQIKTHLAEIETLMTGYTSSGKIDESQAMEIETSIQYVLDNHPIKQKEQEIEDILANALGEDVPIGIFDDDRCAQDDNIF